MDAAKRRRGWGGRRVIIEDRAVDCVGSATQTAPQSLCSAFRDFFSDNFCLDGLGIA